MVNRFYQLITLSGLKVPNLEENCHNLLLITGRPMKIQLMVENESTTSSNIGSRIGVPNRGRGGNPIRSFRGARRGGSRGRGGQRGPK